MTGPHDRAAAGRDRLRAGHADREQVIETLKTAFVHGRLTRDELDARAGQALTARTWADLAALTADIPAGPAAAGPGPGPPPAAGQGGRRVGRLPGHRVRRRAGRASSSIRTAPAPIPTIPGLNRSCSWPSPPYSRHWASWCSGWPPRWSSGAPAGSCRPGRGRAATPWTANDPAAQAMTRFPPAPAPTRPAPTCGHTSHGSAFPPGRAGHPVAPDRRPARYDARETVTGTGASPVVQAGLYVLARTRFPRDRARKQAARERAEPVLRKPESNGTQVCTKLARLRW